MIPTKTVVSQAKLPPPKKPLPCSPVRTPLVSVAEFPVVFIEIPHFWLPGALLGWELLRSCHATLRNESVAMVKKAQQMMGIF